MDFGEYVCIGGIFAQWVGQVCFSAEDHHVMRGTVFFGLVRTQVDFVIAKERRLIEQNIEMGRLQNRHDVNCGTFRNFIADFL